MLALGLQLGKNKRSAAFSPTDIAGLKLWLDASQITGLNDGDAVATWSDLSGNANHATQATASARPTYQTSEQNGRPGVLGDGIDDLLVCPNSVIPSVCTIYLVTRQVTASGYSRLFGNGDISSLNGTILLTQAGTGAYYWALRGGTTSDIILAPVPALATTYIYRLAIGAGGTVAYVNGAVSGSNGGTSTGAGLQPLELFHDGNGGFSNNLLFELLVYNTKHDAATQAQMENYLNAKWAAY